MLPTFSKQLSQERQNTVNTAKMQTEKKLSWVYHLTPTYNNLK
jgi:hypothetical protein